MSFARFQNIMIILIDNKRREKKREKDEYFYTLDTMKMLRF